MKVLQIINSLEIGGAENILYHIVPKLNEKGIETDIFVFFDRGELLAELKSKNIRLITPNTSFLGTKFLELILHIKKEKYNIVHTHLGISNYIGRIAALLAGVKKIIMHEHGGLLIKSPLKRIISFFLHTFTDQVCYISKHDLDYFSKLDYTENSSKNVLISNPSLYPITPLPTAKQVRKIGMIGRLIELKGHIFALSAFLKLENTRNEIEFILLGDGEDKIKNELNFFANKHSLKFKIIKASPDLTEYYKSFDILVHPSLSEGFGLVIVEAMSFGIPVVASNVGGIKDIIEDGYNGMLSEPGDSESILSQLKKLIENYELRKNISANARDTVQEKYSLENYINRLVKLYES